jgi:acyl carrier protein
MTQPVDAGPPLAGPGHVTPRTEVEQLIVEVWAEVLGRDDIGVHDDFFALGGQSLQVARTVNQIQLLTGLEVELRAFFEMPTVAGLADHVVEQFAALESAENTRVDTVA